MMIHQASTNVCMRVYGLFVTHLIFNEVHHHRLLFPVQVFRAWQHLQKQAAHVQVLKELQMMHQAAMHHRKMLAQQILYAWAEAAVASKEEAAAQARKEQTWNKIHSWLAQDTGRQTNLQAITEPAFLQVTAKMYYLRGRLAETCIQQCCMHLSYNLLSTIQCHGMTHSTVST